MPDLQNLLDQIDWLDKAATNGPWEEIETDDLEVQIAHVKDLDWLTVSERVVKADDATRHDKEFIALARTALPQFAKALRAVMELHKTRVHDEDPTSPFCNICGPGTPCETTRAITDAMGADHD